MERGRVCPGFEDERGWLCWFLGRERRGKKSAIDDCADAPCPGSGVHMYDWALPVKHALAAQLSMCADGVALLAARAAPPPCAVC